MKPLQAAVAALDEGAHPFMQGLLLQVRADD